MPIARLDRTVLRLSGDGVEDWLDGLITNKIAGDITFAALLTPQGKIIADFFVTRDGDDLRIDTPVKFGDALEKRLKLYRLRAPIEITRETVSVYTLWGEENEIGHTDPRHPSLGQRLISGAVLEVDGNYADGDYNAHRLSLSVVDSHWDFETQTRFPADANMDLMHGVDFKKGCFIGQEVVSRMKRMTTVKKRMRGLILSGAASTGDKIMAGERVIGEVLSVHEGMGIGLIRLDRLKAAEASPEIGGAGVTIMEAVNGDQA
jgi:folate-binding protein YgfZ